MLPLTAITERRIKVRPGAAIWGRALQICRGKFFPTTGGSKIVQPEQGSAVANDVADLDHPRQTYELGFRPPHRVRAGLGKRQPY